MGLSSQSNTRLWSTSEKEAMRGVYDRVAMDHLPAILNGILIVAVFFTIFDFIEMPAEFAFRIIPHDFVVIATTAVGRFLLLKKMIPERLANPSVAFVALTLMSNIIYTYSLTRNPIFSAYLIVSIMGASIAMTSYYWYGLLLIVGTSAWAVISRQTMSVDQLSEHGIAFFATIVMGMLFIRAKLGAYRRIEVYRLRDQESRRAMADAVDEMRNEVIQRRQIEEEKKKLEDRLLQSQKMEAIGRLAGGVAHDMNNMLTAIKSSAEIIHDDITEKSPHWNDLQVILSACRRGSDLTHNLLGFARLGKYRREYIRIEDSVREASALLFRTIPKKIEIIEEHTQTSGPIVGDPSQINQVIVNLILNSVDAMKSGGTIIIRTGRVELDESDDRLRSLELEPGEYVELAVIDNGEGMDTECASRAFEPFYTRKDPGEGTGLGLAMVYGTVKNHGGGVLLKSTPKIGTTVTVFLPEYRGSTIPKTFLPVEKKEQPSDSRRILLVDDEPLIRQSIERMLRRMGHQVTSADGGRDAVEKLIKAPSAFDLVLLDLMMPVMDGEETFNELRRIHADIDILLMSGYTKEAMADRLISKGAVGFIHKPFDFDEVTRLITEGRHSDNSRLRSAAN